MVNKVAQRAIAAGLAGMMSFGAVAPAAMALDTHSWSSWWNWNDTTSDEGLTYWRRIAGDDRYGTMKKIVEASYKINGDAWWQASVAVVASGDNFPDALAANGLAGALNGGAGAPVILTKKGSLSSQAKELLQKMSVQTVYIMGGTSAVSEATENAIKDLKIATVRVAGADRQATSVAAFKLIDGNWYKNHGTHSVIIATGANYADALSIAPFAYRTGTPVVLTKADGTLTDEAVKAIKDNDQIYQLIVVGGSAVVSDSVFSVLGTYNGSYRDYYNKVYVPVRIAGADRYDTSAKIADWEVNYAYDIKNYDVNDKTNYWMSAGFSYYETFVATGENFPDALAGGQLAGGKYYANSTATTATRWGNITYSTPTIKAASPILLTKDGNRAADAVIAAGLAWNPTKVSVNAYEFVDAKLSDYLDSYLTPGMISPDVYVNDAYGFFTDKVPGALDDSVEYAAWIAALDAYNTALAAAQGKAEGSAEAIALKAAETALDTAYNTLVTKQQTVKNPVDIKKVNAAWIDGYRVNGNNFQGVIFGGKAAVSKDKAKQLDDTVKDSIYKINDPVSYVNGDSVVNINGKTYHTLGWLTTNTSTWFNSLGVNGVTVSGNPWKNTYTVDSVIAVPYGNYGNYRYLYQPYAVDQTNVTYDGAKVKTQTYVIDFAKFDSMASWARLGSNSYTGYGLTGYAKLEVKMTYTYDISGNVISTTYDSNWTDTLVK